MVLHISPVWYSRSLEILHLVWLKLYTHWIAITPSSLPSQRNCFYWKKFNLWERQEQEASSQSHLSVFTERWSQMVEIIRWQASTRIMNTVKWVLFLFPLHVWKDVMMGAEVVFVHIDQLLTLCIAFISISFLFKTFKWWMGTWKDAQHC